MRWLLLTLLSMPLALLGRPGFSLANAQTPGAIHQVTITIRADGMTADPDLWDSRDRRLTAPVTATWVNLDTEAHFIRADRTGGPVIGRLEPGESKVTTVTGVEKYGCEYHQGQRLVILAVHDPSLPAPTVPPRLNVTNPRAGFRLLDIEGVESPPDRPLVVAWASPGDEGERDFLGAFDPDIRPALANRPVHSGETVIFSLHQDGNGNGSFDGDETDPPITCERTGRPIEVHAAVLPAFPLRVHGMDTYITGSFLQIRGGIESTEFDFAAAFADPPAKPLSEQLLIAFAPLIALTVIGAAAAVATRRKRT